MPAAGQGRGIDGIELNYTLENDLSPKWGRREYHAIRRLAEEIDIAISGLCSFLFWPYPLTAADPERRVRGLGVENLLVVPGAVHIPWRDDYEPVPNDVCDRRAREAIGRLLPAAEKFGVSLNIENIFFNGYLMTPGEMIDFVAASAASGAECTSIRGTHHAHPVPRGGENSSHSPLAAAPASGEETP